MRRSVGVPASLTVLIGLPFLIATVPAKPEAPAAVEPFAAALTVEADSDRGTTYVRVRAVGNQPAKKTSAVLASDDGLERGRVEPSDDEQACQKAAGRTVTHAMEKTTVWCLKLTNLPEHGEVAGTIAGVAQSSTEPATKLSLKVQRREAFWPDAFWWLGGGLVAGLLVALFVPWLTARVSRGRVGLLLGLNELRPVRERVKGLRAWADARSEDEDDAAVRAEVAKVMSDGPAKARDARSELETALREATALGEHPLKNSARKEARRIGHRVEDFLATDGTSVPHPATALKAAIEALVAHKTRLDELFFEMAEKLKPSCYPPEVGAARLAWARAERPDEIPAVGELVDQARYMLDKAVSTEDCLLKGVSAGGLEASTRSLTFGASAPLSLEAAGLFAVVGVWGLVTLLSVLVAVAFAGLTTYMAAYEAKPTFGSFAEEFALFTAALGSGVAATVLGLLAPWGDGIVAEGD